MARLVFHIGTYKTGSTAIQFFMRDNRQALHQLRIIYPEFPDRRHSHTSLRRTLNRDNKTAYVECLAVIRRAADEAGNDGTVVLSSEHFWAMSGSTRRTIMEALRRIFPNIRVVMYVRSQDRLWASLYSQQAKHLGVKPEHPLWGTDAYIGSDIVRHGMYYFECLEPYAEMLGRDSVTARLYERPSFPDGDVVKDFFRTANLTFPDHTRRAETDANSSYGWKAVEFSKFCSVHLRGEGHKNLIASSAVRSTIKRLAREDGHSDWLGASANFLSADDQREIRRHYATSNIKLYERYFGGRNVFDKDDFLPACPYRFADIPDQEMRSAMRYLPAYIGRQEDDTSET